MKSLLIALLSLFGSAWASDPVPIRVLFQTDAGEIELELDAAHAPVTVANFLRYIDKGFYDGGSFHRTVTPSNQPQNNIKIEVIQASVNPTRENQSFSPIALETTKQTGIKHLNGAISMARAEPDSATSDFFICIGDQPALDFGGKRNPDEQGFAAFGRVSKGMDVVRKIQASPADGQTLTPPIRIVKAIVLK
jgi:peptidyl-prolyl cis-trans isomerase A (cyclophilin A)